MSTTYKIPCHDCGTIRELKKKPSSNLCRSCATKRANAKRPKQGLRNQTFTIHCNSCDTDHQVKYDSWNKHRKNPDSYRCHACAMKNRKIPDKYTKSNYVSKKIAIVCPECKKTREVYQAYIDKRKSFLCSDCSRKKQSKEFKLKRKAQQIKANESKLRRVDETARFLQKKTPDEISEAERNMIDDWISNNEVTLIDPVMRSEVGQTGCIMKIKSQD